jgi:hypothetical protein
MNRFSRILLTIIVITTALFTALVPAGITATTTYYNSKSSDGYLYRTAINANAGVAWTTARDTATSSGVDATSNNSYARVAAALSGSDYIAVVTRGGLLFDTSSLPDTAIVSAANVQLYVISKWTDMMASSDINLQCANAHNKPSDPIVVADFDYTIYPNVCSSVAMSGMSTNAYNTWTLNAAGLAAVSLTSLTRFLVQEEIYDIADNLPDFGAGAYKYQGISYYNYEAGSSYFPILNITYSIPAVPTVTALSATSIASTGAVLNGLIDDDGGYPAGVATKWGYGTTSQTSANFALYDTVDGGFAGAFSTGSAVSKTLAGGTLITGTTYYYRFQAQNTAGTTTSDEITFTTLSVPVITAKAASNVAQTSAQLNGEINNYGGAVCEVSWGYGTTSQAAADFHHYDTITAFSGSYVTGNMPYLSVGSLTAATPYYFRFQAKNSVGTVTSSTEITFTTETTVGTPAGLIGIPTATTIKLDWGIGTGGASQFMVRVQAGSYPTTTADGALVYLGSALTYTVIGLTPGQVYYYSVWGESGGTYSISYDTCMVTTNAGSTTTASSGSVPSPWRWASAPDYTNLSNIPVVYDAVNGVAVAIGMPEETFWMLLALFSSAMAGIMSYVGSGQAGRGQQSQAIGMIVGLGLLVLWYAIEIIPFYIIVLDIMWVIFTFRGKREMD